MWGVHGAKATVITEAQPSYDDEFRARRRKYVVMMAMRVPFLIAGALLYRTPWLAIGLILISIPLPWIAVLIANDGPARKLARSPRGVRNSQRQLTSGAARVIEPSGEDASDPAE